MAGVVDSPTPMTGIFGERIMVTFPSGTTCWRVSPARKPADPAPTTTMC